MEDAPEEILGMTGVEEGTPVLDECSPEYGLGIRGERQWQRMEGPGAEEEPAWVGEVIGVGGGQEAVEERSEGWGEARESLQTRIERELALGGLDGEHAEEVNLEVEETARMGESGNTEEVIKWMTSQLMEDESMEEEELKERTLEKFGSRKLPTQFHWIVVGIKEGLRRGKEDGRKRERRRRDIRVQTENVSGCGVRVQTDMTGTDLEKMEKRAYESIRASRKKSKARSELGSEKLEVTITTKRLENEVEVVMEGKRGMPELLEIEECVELGEGSEQGELPVLRKEGVEQGSEEELSVGVIGEEEEFGLGEIAEIELEGDRGRRSGDGRRSVWRAVRGSGHGGVGRTG